MSKQEPAERPIAENRRARHEYTILETVEAGLVLTGSEVKSLRNGRATIADGWVLFKNGEAWVTNVHIPPYEEANRFNHEPLRDRKLLLHGKEIDRLASLVARQGCTVIPLELRWSGGRAKLLLGLGKGKKAHDKREAEKAHDAKREIARALRRG
jgi:SsrA-binding protein